MYEILAGSRADNELDAVETFRAADGEKGVAMAEDSAVEGEDRMSFVLVMDAREGDSRFLASGKIAEAQAAEVGVEDFQGAAFESDLISADLGGLGLGFFSGLRRRRNCRARKEPMMPQMAAG